MAKKIILKEGGINGFSSPEGYQFLGLNSGLELGLKDGVTFSVIKGGVGGAIIPGTYDEIKELAESDSLLVGNKYLITDFRTRYRLFDPDIDGDVFQEGSIEPLIVVAATTSEFTGMAISTVYPEDEIVYQFENIDILAELTTKFANGSQDPDIIADAQQIAANIVSDINFTAYGADRGYIEYRKDRRNRLAAHYDWREYKFKRFENPDIPGVYSEWNFNGEAEKQLLTFFNFKDPYAESLANQNYKIVDTSIGALYRDGYLVANNVVLYADVDAPSNIQCYDNVINNADIFNLSGRVFYQNYIDADQFERNICVPLSPGGAAFYSNFIQGRTVSANNFAGQVSNNAIIASNITSNTFGSPTSQPTQFCNFSENQIVKSNFQNNTFKSQSFVRNMLSGAEVLNCQVDGPRVNDNDVLGVIYDLTLTGFVTAAFARNTIETQASLNSVVIDCPNTSANFQYNRIQCRDLGPIDFGSSTTQHVRKFTYNKTLTTQADGTNIVTFIDATGAFTVAPVTA